MSKGCYFAKNPENFIDFSGVEKETNEKKVKNFCSKCGAEMLPLRTGQGWGFELTCKCPNCTINWGHSKGFRG